MAILSDIYTQNIYTHIYKQTCTHKTLFTCEASYVCQVDHLALLSHSSSERKRKKKADISKEIKIDHGVKVRNQRKH